MEEVTDSEAVVAIQAACPEGMTVAAAAAGDVAAPQVHQAEA